MDITQLGKGAFPDVPDERDFKLPMGAVFVDWATPFVLPEPPSNDQNGSLSCVAQAWSYYHWQIRGKDFSRRDIYSQIFEPSGGAYIRNGGLRLINYGQATRDETPDPTPETEVAMRDRTGVGIAKEKSDQELNSFIVPDDIDSTANAIKQWKGVVFGVIGSDPGWKDLTNPRPPLSTEVTWGHALYLFGHHLHNGVKCVIAKSSWGTNGNTTVHHIKEDYFTSRMTFNPWTLIRKDNMTNVEFVHKAGTQEYGFYVPALSVDALKDKALNFDVPLVDNNGNVDFTLAKEVSGL